MRSETPRTERIMDHFHIATVADTREQSISHREEAQREIENLECELTAARAELAALRAEQDKPQWLPIESAPRDGTVIQLGNEHGAWFGHWKPVYQSGFKPKNPWFSLMLNHEHMGRVITIPTHWMPLPAAPPRDLREGGE